MKTQLITAASTSLLLTMSGPAASAEAPSWDYLSLEWVVAGDAETDGFEEDIDGFRWQAAKELGDFAMLRAGSGAYHIEESGSDIKQDLATEQFGLGAHYPVTQGPIAVDVWGSVNYERLSLVGLTGTGPGVDLGVRAMFSPAFEMGVTGKVHGDLDFGTVLDDADYTGYTVYGDFYVMPNMAIQASFNEYELDFGTDTLDYSGIVGLGVRFNY